MVFFQSKSQRSFFYSTLTLILLAWCYSVWQLHSVFAAGAGTKLLAWERFITPGMNTMAFIFALALAAGATACRQFKLAGLYFVIALISLGLRVLFATIVNSATTGIA